MSTLAKIIKNRTGMFVGDFVRTHLKISYQSFRWRLNAHTLRLDEYHKIILHTGLTFEELFPSPYAVPKVLQKVVLRPPTMVNKDILIKELRQDLAQTIQKREGGFVASQLTAEESQDAKRMSEDIISSKKEVPPVSSSELAFEDIYSGGHQPL